MSRREWSLLLFLALVLALMGVKAPGFFEMRNLVDLLVNSAYVAIAASGMTLVIVAAGIDISVGSQLALCSVVAALVAKAGLPMALVCTAAVLTGAAVGAVNGALTAFAGVPSIIVTLGMMSVIRGVMYWITKGYWITGLPRAFSELGLGKWAGTPKPILIAAATVVLVAMVAARTPWGRGIYAIGGNPEAARLAGIPVRRDLFLVFVLCGALVGLCALTYATRFTVVQSNAGLGFELLVITAVVVGGANIFGGSGTLLGSTLAVLLLAVIGSALTFLHVSAYWEQMVQGVMILAAILLDVARERGRTRGEA